MFAVLYIHFCICTDLTTGIFHEPNTPSDFRYNAHDIQKYSDEIHSIGMKFTEELQTLTLNDHLIFKLLILIILFSKGADTIESVLIEPEKVFRIQNIFVDLLWNYLNVRFGADQISTIFSRLIFSLLKCHSLARKTKEEVVKKTAQIDELAPLMQSILSIS